MGGTLADNIASWDGTSWTPLGSGVDGDVYYVTTFNGDLIAAGRFWNADGQPAASVARWDGSSWHARRDGLDGTVAELIVHESKLYATGYFNNSGATTTRNIASWTWASRNTRTELQDQAARQTKRFCALLHLQKISYLQATKPCRQIPQVTKSEKAS